MKPVNFALIGCGGIAGHHAEAMKSLEEVRLVAVQDLAPETARRMAEKYGCDWHQDYDELLARPDVEAVDLCTPSGLHPGQGIQAALAGKHVLSEKPIGLNLAKIDELISTCDRQGVKLGSIFQSRFGPNNRKVKQAIEQGKFGRLVFVNADCKWWRSQQYYDSSSWRGSWAMDGGVLANQAIHCLDQLVWLTDELPEVVSAQIATLDRRMEAENVAQVELRFSNGARGFVQASSVTYPGLPARVEVCGTKGCAILSSDDLLFYQVEGEQAAGGDKSASGESDPLAISWKLHALQIQDFARAIREDRQPYVDGRQARRTVEFLMRIYRKAGAFVG